MSSFNPAELKADALEWLREELDDAEGLVRIETDLIEEGVIDSVGLIELVEFIEERSGLQIDLEEVAEDQLSSIEGLCEHLTNSVEKNQDSVPKSDIPRSYSEHAEAYENEEAASCWGVSSARLLDYLLNMRQFEGVVVDAGCGTGRALTKLASKHCDVEFIGIEPAENMRSRASSLASNMGNVRVIDGRFEELPLESGSVDYLYSLYAFHWTTDLDRSIQELGRVLGTSGKMDLFFTGRETGREFTKVTTPIYTRYLGLEGLLRSAAKRVHLGKNEAWRAFARIFDDSRLVVSESFETYYDTLENHWSWWVARASGHFSDIKDEQREACESAVRSAIASLNEERGIPYTVHTIHVQVTG